MKKISIILLILFGFLLDHPISAFASEIEPANPTDSTVEMTVADEILGDDNSAVSNGSFSLDAVNPLLGTSKLVDNVRAAVVYEANSQTLMYACDADKRMQPASMVKNLTALIAIRECGMDEMVTVGQEGIASMPNDAISANLVPGEVISMQDLLYCLLMKSANDAAIVIAEHISGSVSNFVVEMNRVAEELGCTGSYFTNPHGLHDDNQYSTARDTAKIMVAAMNEPAFRTIIGSYSYVVPPTNMSEERRLVSGNSMKNVESKLYYDSRVIGGKTGVTQDGRRCLTTAAESNGMLVICVVMGAESIYQEDGYSAIRIGGYHETSKLFDVCLDGYKTAQILRADQILRQIPIEGAENDLIVAPSISVSTVLPKNIAFADLTLKFSDKPFKLPILKGQHISDVQIWYDGMCVAQAQLFAMNDVFSYHRVLSDDSGLSGRVPTIVWVLLVVIAAVVLTLCALRFRGTIERKLMRIRSKRYRRDRKRTK